MRWRRRRRPVVPATAASRALAVTARRAPQPRRAGRPRRVATSCRQSVPPRATRVYELRGSIAKSFRLPIDASRGGTARGSGFGGPIGWSRPCRQRPPRPPRVGRAAGGAPRACFPPPPWTHARITGIFADSWMPAHRPVAPARSSGPRGRGAGGGGRVEGARHRAKKNSVPLTPPFPFFFCHVWVLGAAWSCTGCRCGRGPRWS